MRVLVLSACVWWLGCSTPPAAPALTQVQPPQVDELQGGPIELHGTDLKPAVQVDFDHPSASAVDARFTAWLERDGVRTDLADVTWLSAEVVAAAVPGGLAAGRYDVHLVDPRGREAALPHGLEVVDCFTATCTLPDGGAFDAGDDEFLGRFDAGWTECGDFTFEDLDLDQFGRPDSGAFLCGAYRASVDGDCNDRDDLMRPDAAEVCNQLDDDCDGQVDEGACPDGGASWTRIMTTGPNWRTAWSWARGAVWVAGESSVSVRRDATGFDSVSSGCPGNLASSWAEPSGRAYVGGGNPALGRLAVHELVSSGCGMQRQVSDPVVGIVGFPRADGGVDVVGVLRNGRLLRGVDALDGPEAPSNVSSAFRFEDLHGVGPAALYAVGSDPSADPARMKAFRLGADGGWVDEHVERLPGLPRGALRAVWVLDAERAVAAGDNGVLLERTPFGWFRVPGPTDDRDFTGARAFSLGRVYLTDTDGNVRRWTGQRWERLYQGSAQLHDVTGTVEDDLWCVGSGGAVVHWPE